MIPSKYFFPLRSSSIFIVLALFWDFGNSETLTLGTKSSSSFKTAGYESLVPTNSTREGRRSVVSGGLFSIVSFDNVPCLADSGDVGTCYSQRECTNLNGNGLGACAGNYGVCCVITVTSGSTVTTNNTYFVNPDYPSPTVGPLTSTLTINKLAGAAELYLEFTNFQILGPSKGDCLNDTFKVSIGGSSLPPSNRTLCGNNVNQMLYYAISTATGPFTLTFTLANTADARIWKIRIVQFFATDSCAAPAGCNQYFQGQSGVVETFNYNNGQGQLINNYCVNICFGLLPGYCSVLLTENEFMLSGTAPNDCTEGDYLLANGKQFCGDTLGNGMLLVNQTTGSSFIQLQVCSGKTNPDMDLGFSLNYTEIACSATG